MIWRRGPAIRARAQVNAANDFGVTPLSLACTNGSAAMVDKLLQAGANPNAALPSGETPLMTCARSGKVEAIRPLLARGVDVNVKETSRGQTALMWAAAEPSDVAAADRQPRRQSSGATEGFTPPTRGRRAISHDPCPGTAGADVNGPRPPNDAHRIAPISEPAAAEFLLKQGSTRKGPGSRAALDGGELSDRLTTTPAGFWPRTPNGVYGRLRGEAECLVKLLLTWREREARAERAPALRGGKPSKARSNRSRHAFIWRPRRRLGLMRTLLMRAEPNVATSNNTTRDGGGGHGSRRAEQDTQKTSWGRKLCGRGRHQCGNQLETPCTGPPTGNRDRHRAVLVTRHQANVKTKRGGDDGDRGGSDRGLVIRAPGRPNVEQSGRRASPPDVIRDSPRSSGWY